MVKLPREIFRNLKLPVMYDKLKHWEKRRVREEYTVKQKGKCYYCKRSLLQKPPVWVLDKKLGRATYPPNFFKHPVHLHHCHRTGLTIGAVHAYCNAVLFEYHGE